MARLNGKSFLVLFFKKEPLAFASDGWRFAFPSYELEFWQCDAALVHVFAGFVGVAGFAGAIALEKEELADAFVGVDAGGEGGGVADFDGDLAFPFGFEGGHVDDDAAARIGGFSQADDQDVAGDTKIFHGVGEGKAVGGDDADRRRAGDEAFGAEILGVDDGAVDVGKDLEFVGDAGVMAFSVAIWRIQWSGITGIRAV